MTTYAGYTGWHLDSHDGGRLRGWVSLANHNKPAYVTAFVDRRRVAEGRADQFRSDLLATEKANQGACAFDLPLEPAEASMAGKVLNVFVGRYMPILIASAVLNDGPPVVLPRMSLWLAHLIQPVARPLLRSLAISTHKMSANNALAQNTLSLEQFVYGVFTAILAREPEQEAVKFYVDNLSIDLDIRAFVESLLQSAEFFAASDKAQEVRESARRAQRTLENMLGSGGSNLKLPPIHAEGASLSSLALSTERLVITICDLAQAGDGLADC